jgi:hypothetical protein
MIGDYFGARPPRSFSRPAASTSCVQRATSLRRNRRRAPIPSVRRRARTSGSSNRTDDFGIEFLPIPSAF